MVLIILQIAATLLMGLYVFSPYNKFVMIGENILQYKILNELGRGGMATVYLAHDQKFDTNVAIKVLNKEFVNNENIRKRFLAEAKNMFKMSHPNIIKVTDLIDAGDNVAFAMEYIEGETLKEYIDRKGKLKDDEVKIIFTQMLEAVGYVHRQNLIHRDIKPSNFMISKDGSVKLMDFGIAKNTDASSAEYTQTNTGMQMGTPMYMSPEQIKSSKDVGPQTDIYSLGVVLWQMVSGKKPYDTSVISSFDLQLKIVQDDLPLTNSVWDNCIKEATHKNIYLRFKNIGSFEIAISRNLQDQTIIEDKAYNSANNNHNAQNIKVDENSDININSQQNRIKYPILYCLLPAIAVYLYFFYCFFYSDLEYDLFREFLPYGSDFVANIFLVAGFMFYIIFNENPLLENLKQQPVKNALAISGALSLAFISWQARLWYFFFKVDDFYLRNIYINDSLLMPLFYVAFSIILISLFINNKKN
jgi:serine/threonine protein kinase